MPGRLVGVGPSASPGAVLLVITVVFLALACLVAVGAPRLGPRVLLAAAAAPAVALVWAWSTSAALGAGEARSESWAWVPELGLELAFRFDGLTLVMWALIAGIGVLVLVYAASYMSPGPGLGRFAATMLLFGVAMLGVVSSDNVLALFLFWELTSVTSFLLIGTNDETAAARSGALQALLITGAGGLAMLGGFVLLGQTAGTYSLSAMLADPPRGTAVDVAIVMVLVGALTKSAQVPFHSWLPRAMNAPTPVSAYLHSATMVNAGVYLVARLSPAFAEVTPWRPIVIGCGAATLVVGGYRAVRQFDLKLVLAYSTISQLGLMMVLFGVGTEATTFAGVTLLVAHGVFKAALFMVVGVIDHQTHTRDLRVLGGVARAWPAVTVVAGVAAASMAGLPPTLGFIAKEEALASLVDLDAAWTLPVVAVVVAGSMLTVAYSARFVWGACGPRLVSRVRDQDYREPSVAVPSAWFVAPAAILAGASLLFGVAPGLVGGAVEHAVESMWPPSGHHLALWHGVTAALGLSAIVIVGGLALFWQRRRIEKWQDDMPALPSAQGGYERSLKGVLHGADVVTGVVQNGSLPVYLGVILATFALAAGVPLLGGIDVPPLRLAASPLQLLVGVLIVAAAFAAALARHRFAAVVLVGVVGYGMAGLYLIQGAPDLAITQLLIETLGIVVFVLVVRHLPTRFDPVQLRGSQLPRVAVAVVSALVVFAVTLAVAGRSERTVAEGYLARSYPEGGGNNVVNVIIVDFRGFDTLGEITVLVVAALGVASLIGVRRRSTPSGADEDASPAAREPVEEVAPWVDGR